MVPDSITSESQEAAKVVTSAMQPACMREQAASVNSAMQIPASVQKNSAAKGFERWTSSLGPQIAYHSDYEELLYRRHPQSYLIRAKKENSPLINHSLALLGKRNPVLNDF